MANIKYKENGEYKDIVVKVGDTLPIGAIIGFDTTGTIPNGWEYYAENQIKKIALVTPANGNIENAYGTSQENTYSQEYLNNYIEDTGWQTPTIGSDFNIGGSFKYKKIGSIVFVNLTVSAKNNIALKDALNVIATGLPAPDTDTELATYIATGNLTFRICLRTTGNLQLYWNTAGTLQADKNFTITFTYMV